MIKNNKFTIVQNGDSEELGLYFLSKAIDFSFKEEYSIAYAFILEGLDLSIIDNRIYEVIKEVFGEKKELLFTDDSNSYEINFIKAYFLSLEKDDKLLILGLKYIEYYLLSRKDTYAYYIKGYILYKLSRFDEAISNFEKSLEKDELRRSIYYKGKIKEKNNLIGGLAEFYITLVNNPFCSTCAFDFKRSLNKKLKKLEVSINIRNTIPTFLLDSLISDSNVTFLLKYREAVSLKRTKTSGFNFSEIKESTIIEFNDFLYNNYELFDLDECISKSGYKYYKKINILDLSRNNSSIQSKSRVDLSDNYINDALDGFPEAYWNID